MRGNVIGFDPDTNTGAITGDDGRRYDFTRLEWQGSGTPGHGDLAAFTADGERAIQIRLLDRAYVRLSVAQFYFSPRGRISRSHYWLRFVAPAFAIAVVLRLTAFILGKTSGGAAAMLLLGLFYVAALWPSIAVLVKRMHDRGKAGWLTLLFYIPFFLGIVIAFAAVHAVTVGDIHDGNQLAILGAIVFGGAAIVGIWFFIEFGCMRGTIGANRYGADPLGRR